MSQTSKLVRLTYIAPNGKRMYVSGHTRKEAEEKREAILRDLKNGIVHENPTFGALAEHWLKMYAARKDIHLRTYESAETIFRRYLIPYLGHLRIKDIKPMQIDYMLSSLSNLSNNTQRRILTFARNIFSMAIENDLILKDPCASKKPIGVKPEAVKALTPQQCEELLAATKGTRVYPFIVLCLFAGLRKGEALGLMWKDVDFQNGMLRVERSVIYSEHNKNGQINKDLKTTAARRIIPLSPEVMNVLIEERKKAKSMYVIPGGNGSFQTESSFKKMWDLVSYRTFGGKGDQGNGLRTLTFNVHPHQLRHTCCTRWIYSGMTPKEAQYLMGHATADVTMNIYAEFQESVHLKEAAVKVCSDSLKLAMG